MPCRPSSPIAGHRSRGNVLVRSISSARGAMRSCAKRATVSRIMSASSPRLKSNGRGVFGIMGATTTTLQRGPAGRRRLAGVDGAALRAGARLLVGVERLEQRRQILDDVSHRQLDAVHARTAVEAEPLEAVAIFRPARAFDHQADR